MKNKQLIWGIVFLLAAACPLASAFLMATDGHPPRPLPPLTPILSPTIMDFLTSAPPEQSIITPPAAAPIFVTHAAIETRFAATTIALTPTYAKE